MQSDRITRGISGDSKVSIQTSLRRRRSLMLGAAAIGAVSMLGQRPAAANDIWVGNNDANWGNGANWLATTVPVSGDTLEFNAAGTAGVTLSDNLMTPATYNVGGLIFDATAAAFIINPATAGTNGFTLTGNITDNATVLETINDTINLNSATPTINLAAGASMTLGGAIGGSTGLTVSGAGTTSILTLSGANTFTGGLNISNAEVLNAPAASIPAANSIVISNGGVLYSNAVTQTYTNNVSLSGSTLRSGGNKTTTFSGAVSLTGADNLSIDGGATLTVSGSIGGAGNLTILGGGTAILTGSNTFGGGTTVTAGVLNINGDAALGAVPASPTTNLTYSATGTLLGGAGLVNLNANRNLSIASGATMTFDPGASNMMIINGSITDAGTAITKTADSGILVWGGVNSFASGTTFTFAGTNPSDDGILRLTNSGALGTLPMTINLNEGNQSPALVELSGGITVGNGAGGPGTFAGDVITRPGAQAGDPSLRNLSGNNAYNGIVAVANSGGQMTIESADPNGTLTLGGNISTGAATTTITNRTILLYGSGNGLISGTISNVAPATLGVAVTNTAGTVGTVVVGGAAGSTWTFTGANTYTATTQAPVLNLAGGTAVVNYSLGGSFGSTTNLTLAGGNLTMIGSASGTAQSYAGTLIIGGAGATTAVAGAGVTGGGSNVVINPNGGTTTLTLPNAWVRDAGGTVNFNISATNGTPAVAVGTVTGATAALTNGIFGYGTVNDSSGIGFATTNGTNVVKYTGASPFTATSNSATTNFSTSGSLTINPAASFAVNSLAIDASGSGTLDLGGATDVMTLTSGGLLMTNATAAGNYTIQDGQVGLAAKELIVQQYGSGTLTINGTVSSGAGSLTKSGPGTLILGGANAYTGTTTINTGVLSVSADNNLGSTTGTIAPIIFNGGTLAVTSGFTMSARAITLDPAGGTLDIAPSQTLTIGSIIASPVLAVNGGTGLSAGPLIKTDTGTLTLTGTANTYTGGTFLKGGTLNIAADGSLGQIPGSLQAPGIPDINVVFAGNSTLQAGAAGVSLQFNRTTLIDTGVTATLDPLANTMTVAGAITSQSSSGALAIGAAGTGTVALTSAVSSYTVPTVVNSGSLNVTFLTNGGNLSSIGATSNAASNLILANGTTLNYTGGTTSTDRSLTVNSGSANFGVTNAATELTWTGTAVAGSGSIGLNKVGAGTLAFASPQSYTGATNVNAGALLVNSTLASSSVNVALGATLGGNGTTGAAVLSNGAILSPGDPLSNTGIGTLTASSLSLASGSVLKFDFGASSNDQVNVTTSGGLSILGGTLTPLVAGTANIFGTNGTYNLFGYTGAVPNFANLSIGTTAPGHAYSFVNNATTHEIQLSIISAVSAAWNVNGGGVWNLSTNWNPNSIPNSAGEAVTFGPVVTGGSATVDLNGTTETVGQVIFNNSTSSYTIANSGSGSLVLNNSPAAATIAITGAIAGGGHTISAPVTYSGNLNLTDTVSGTTLTLTGGFSGSGALGLQSGTLQIGAGGTFSPYSTGPITMAASSAAIFDTSSSLQLAAVTAANGAGIIQNGSGAIKLASTGNSFGNLNLQVNNGTFDLNGNSLTATTFSGNGNVNQTVGTGIITDTSAAGGTSTFTYSGGVSTTTSNSDFYGQINDGTGANAQKLALTVALTTSTFILPPATTAATFNNTLTLHSASNYSGGTTLNTGILAVVNTDNNGGGLGTGPVTINNTNTAIATQLQLGNGTTLNNPITINAAAAGTGFGVLTVTNGGGTSVATSSNVATFGGPITINTSGTPASGGDIVGPGAAGGNLIFKGPIILGPNATVLLVRDGNVQFADTSGTSSYPAIGITGPGTASLGANNGIATNAVVEPGLNNTAGVIDLAGFNQTVAGITTPTAAGLTSTIGTNSGTSTLTVNTSATAFPDTAPDTYGGLLAGDTVSAGGLGIFALVKTGPGTLLLTNPVSAAAVAASTAVANNYVGGTLINQGVLGATTLSSGGNAGSVGYSGLVTRPLGLPNSDVTFNGGSLRYTGVSAATNQTFVVNPGVVGELDISTAGTALTWQGQLTGGNTPTGFIKGGPGTLIIDPTFTNSYSGNTTINAGTMVVNSPFGTAGQGSTLSITGATTVLTTQGTGTIAGALDHTAGTISIPAPGESLTFSDSLKLDGGTSQFTVNGAGLSSGVDTNTQGLVIANALSFGAAENVLLQFTSTPSQSASPFIIPLFQYSSLTGGPNLSVTSSLGRATYSVDTTSHPGFVSVVVTTNAAANLLWDSTSSTSWDVQTSSNWFNGTGTAQYFQGDNVTFADNSAIPGNPTLVTGITLAVPVNPASVTFSANSNNYTISGAGKITGLANVLQSGTGTTTLETANDYSGTTTITAGTLNIGGGTAVGSLGTGAVAINGGTLLYNVAAPSTFSNSVTGSGNLAFATVSNANEVIQNGDLSGFNGILTVQSGILRPAAANPLSNASNVVQNGGEMYFDTGSNHAPSASYSITINGTGTTPVAGATGGNNDGAIRVGSATLTTLSGAITVASNALIGLDGGATLSLTNPNNALVGSGTTLSLTGGGILELSGNINQPTLTLAAGTSPVTLAAPVSSNININMPITGTGTVTINSFTTPAANTPSSAGTVTLGSNPGYTGGFLINTGDLLISSATALGTNANGTTINGTGALGVVTGTLQLATTGTAGSPVTIPGNFTLGGHGTATDIAPMITQAHIENISGVNVLSGNIVPTTGGDYYDIQSDAGSLTMQGNFNPGALAAGTTPTTVVAPTAPSGAFRVLQLEGAGNGTWSGTINNGSAAVIALNMGISGSTTGTWTLSGVNTYTGPTAVIAGTLTLADTGVIATSSANAVNVASGTIANINGLLTGSPQVIVNGNMNVGPADANNDPALGTVPLARNVTTLAIGSGAAVTLPALTGPSALADRSVLVVKGTGTVGTNGLSFADTTGTLDMGNNDMILKNAGAASLSTVTAEIKQGSNNGTWTGPGGITSSSAAAVATAIAGGSHQAPTGLGAIINNQGGVATFYSSFDGQTVGANDILVKYTFLGDANLDGVINGDDYALIDNGYNTHLSGWQNGDFTYAGSVTAADYTLIDNAFNLQGSSTLLGISAGPAEMIATNTDQIASPSSSSVPEPTSLGLIGIAAVGLLQKRRRRR